VSETSTGQAGLGFYTGDPTLLEEKVRIDEFGNVGIGTTTPSEKLDVVGEIQIQGDTVSEATGLRLYNIAAPVASEATTAISISAGLDSGIGSFIEAGKIVFGEEDDWIGSSGRDSYMAFHTRLNNVLSEAARIDSGGNVGIGTTTPDAELEIVGDLHVSNDVIINISTDLNTTGWIEFADEGIQNSEGNFRIGVLNGRLYFQKRGVTSWSNAGSFQ
jgi:hypothetical protein